MPLIVVVGAETRWPEEMR